MTDNPPADAMRARPSTIVISDWLANCQAGQWTPFEAATALKAALTKEGYEIASAAKTDRDGSDTARLDWLDQVNTRTNDRVGTSYGWKFDINHNRAALTDHNLPALHVRAAIDEARLKSAPVKQEGK
jgi:hypothetical protein